MSDLSKSVLEAFQIDAPIVSFALSPLPGTPNMQLAAQTIPPASAPFPLVEALQEVEANAGNANAVAPIVLPPEVNAPPPAASVPDQRDMARQLIADNNLFSAMHASAKRRNKVQREIQDEYEIARLRQQLHWRQPEPLTSDIEVDRPFPLGVFPDSARTFIGELALQAQARLQLVGPALIGIMFIAARGNFKISADWEEALTGFVGAAALSGERKSATLGPLKEPITQFQSQIRHHGTVVHGDVRLVRKIRSAAERRIVKECIEGGFDSASTLEAIRSARAAISNLEQVEAEIGGKLPFSRVLADMPTMEALPGAVAEGNEAIGIADTEGGFIMHRLRPNANDILLKGYSAEYFYAQGRTFKGHELQAPCVSICSLHQPVILKALFTEKKFAKLHKDGFLARMLPVFVPKMRERRDTSPRAVSRRSMEWYHHHITALLNIERPFGAPGERTFHNILVTDEAREVLAAFYLEITQRITTENPSGGYEGFLRRLHGHALRLAGVLHLLAYTDPQNHRISRASMEGGIELARFFDAHAYAAFSLDKWKALQLAKDVMDWVASENRDTFTPRDVQREVCGGRGNVTPIYSAISALEQHGFVATYRSGNSLTVVVNPRTLTSSGATSSASSWEGTVL